MAQTLIDLPIGAKVKEINTKYNGVPIVWMVIDKNHQGYPSNSVTLISEKIISLKPYDAKESGGDLNRQNSGNNRYLYSNIRQWLNKDSFSWFQKQHSYDNTPDNVNVWSNYNEYDVETGFLANFSNELKAELLPTELKIVKPNVDGGGLEQVTDKVFLLSRTEVGLGNENDAEGIPFSYFNSDIARQANPTAEAVLKSEYTNNNLETEQSWNWWLRTPNINNAHRARYVLPSGSLYHDVAYFGAIGVRPALNLQSEITVSDTVDSDGVYIIQFNSKPTLTLTDNYDRPITQNQTIKHSNKTPFILRVFTQDSDENDTLELSVWLRNNEYQTWTSIGKGVESEISIPFENLLLGNNTIQVKVRDNNGAETNITFVLTNINPKSYSQQHVYELIVALGYAPTGSGSLRALKYPEYNKTTLSLAELVNFLQ